MSYPHISVELHYTTYPTQPASTKFSNKLVTFIWKNVALNHTNDDSALYLSLTLSKQIRLVFIIWRTKTWATKITKLVCSFVISSVHVTFPTCFWWSFLDRRTFGWGGKRVDKNWLTVHGWFVIVIHRISYILCVKSPLNNCILSKSS